MAWKMGVDWHGTGVACLDCLATDQLNDIAEKTGNTLSSAMDYSRYTVGGTTVPDIVPIMKPFGRDAFRVTFTGSDTFKLFDDYATVVNTRHYALVWWYRMIEQDTSGGANTTTPTIYVQTDTVLKATGTALAKTSTWTQGSMTFTGSGTDVNLKLRFTHTAAGGSYIVYDISGLMLIEHTSAFSVPTGFNDGSLISQYDSLTNAGDVLDASWEIGCNSYDTISGEKKATLILNNNHKRYSPDNASSPLYGYMLPKRPVLIYYDDTAYYTGYLDLVTPTFGIAGEQIAKLTATNLVSILNRHPANLTQQESKTVAQLIHNELTNFDSRLAEATDFADSLNSDVTSAYYGDNSQGSGQNITLWVAFAELAEVEHGLLYIDPDGVVTLLPRSYDKSTSTIAADATFSGTALNLNYLPASARMTTRILIKTYPREVGASGTDTLWTLRRNITIPAGQSYTFGAKYRDSTTRQEVGAKDVVTPTGADYTITGGSPSLTFTAYGEKAVIEIDNSAGTTDAVLSVMVIKGRKISTFDSAELIYQDDYLIETYSYRDFSLDLKALDDIGAATALAKYIFPTLSLERGEVKQITIMNADNGTDNATNLALGVGDLISITDTQLGISGLFYIIVGYKHQLDVRGKSHISTYNLEIAKKQTYWILGVSRLGLETVLGR